MMVLLIQPTNISFKPTPIKHVRYFPVHTVHVLFFCSMKLQADKLFRVGKLWSMDSDSDPALSFRQGANDVANSARSQGALQPSM